MVSIGILLPLSNVDIFGQVTDSSPSTLALVLTSDFPYSYRNIDGTTVIVGEVQNTSNSPLRGASIWAGFYDDLSEQPLEITRGTTLLDVIPAGEKSPYIIKSPSANSAITNISVNMLGFNSSPTKQTMLEIEPGVLRIGDEITIPGKITNNGMTNSSNTRVHLLIYDAFEPPRLIGIESIVLEKDLTPGETREFKIITKADQKATSFSILAESNNFNSEYTTVERSSLDSLTKLVTISTLNIADDMENKTSTLSVGSSATISSQIWIKFSQDQENKNQDYVYWIQIKQLGEKGIVEFIGNQEGTFVGATKEFPEVIWTPQNPGAYFIEAYVWDSNNVAISAPSTVVPIVIVKP